VPSLPDHLDRIAAFVVTRLAPVLLRQPAGEPLSHREEWELEAWAELQARISQGRPGPEEWRLGAPPSPPTRRPPLDIDDQFRPVVMRVALPGPQSLPDVGEGVHVEDSRLGPQVGQDALGEWLVG
jgi:hypothetical protein